MISCLGFKQSARQSLPGEGSCPPQGGSYTEPTPPPLPTYSQRIDFPHDDDPIKHVDGSCLALVSQIDDWRVSFDDSLHRTAGALRWAKTASGYYAAGRCVAVELGKFKVMVVSDSTLMMSG